MIPTITKDTLQIDYLPTESAVALANDPSVMALIRFSGATSCSQAGGAEITVGLPQLAQQKQIEVWRTKDQISWYQREKITFCTAGEMLFGHMLLEENPSSNLETLSEQAYHSLLDLTSQQGHPHLIRIWNYFPNINQEQNQQERYRSFCIGRHRACANHEGFENRLPAATAIGTQSAGFLIYFLASKTVGLQVENPRQVSAFRYPAIYSPKSPSFSRAILKAWHGQRDLYLSGTASVVGHKSCHLNDEVAQLQESLRNIQQLLKEASQKIDTSTAGLQQHICLKIYLRQI